MSSIEKHLEKFIKNKNFISEMRPEHQFGLMCANYFYYDDELTNSIVKTIFVDGTRDGGLDIILNDPRTDNLILIQSKMTENLDKNAILDIFSKMGRAIEDYRNGNRKKITDSVRRCLASGLEDLPDDGGIHLILFTTYNPNDKYKSEIKEALENLDINNNYYLEVYYLNNILEQIEYIENPKDYVQFDRIKYNRENGMLRYKDNGLMVNISSKSLITLYEKYKDQGLFDQNLRYFVKQDKVDNSMKDTLDNQIDNFWYFNNGIIIGCDDFTEDGDEIKLQNFSIINGCQTTNIIGNYDGKNKNYEFWIPCKIICSSTKEKNEREFIGMVAEASNTQKPINFRDLVSNRPEQRKLKRELLESNINVEIKRGEKKPSKSQFREKWQRTTNEEIAQLIMAVIYQKPGTARSQKRALFDTTKTKEELYNKIFKKGIETRTIIDLLRLSNYYDIFLEAFIKNRELSNEDIIVAKNGKLFILAIIGLFIKEKRRIIDIKKYRSYSVEEKRRELSDTILGGTLISDYACDNDDFDDILKQLFKRLITSLSNNYNQEYKNGNVTSVSNYFKTDAKYYELIVPTILESLIDNYIYQAEYKQYLNIFDNDKEMVL